MQQKMERKKKNPTISDPIKTAQKVAEPINRYPAIAPDLTLGKNP